MLVRGVPKQGFGGPSVEPLYGARATILVRGVPKCCLGAHAGDLRKSSAWGQAHDPREGCAEMKLRWALGGAPYGARAAILARGVPKRGFGEPRDVRGPCHWDFRKKTLYGAGATILVRGMPK